MACPGQYVLARSVAIDRTKKSLSWDCSFPRANNCRRRCGARS